MHLAERNGCRDRTSRDPGRHDRISAPKLRKRTYFPGFLEPPRMAEKALTALVWIHPVHDLVQGEPVSPIALDAVRHLDALLEIERTISGRETPTSGAPCARKRACRFSKTCTHNCCASQTLSCSSEVLKRMNLHAQALGRTRPLPRRWRDLLDQQLHTPGAFVL